MSDAPKDLVYLTRKDWPDDMAAATQAYIDEQSGGPAVTLMGEQATTHETLTKAARKVEEANRILTDAQSEFRAALAAHLKAITGAKVEP